jgi:mxaJ protein
MYFRSLSSFLLTLAVTHGFAAALPLRVCADPDNLPFSNRAGLGFDNKIAALIAKDLDRQVVFVWARARRGFLREQFNKGTCDVLMGVPIGMRKLATTQPYYRSIYMFVTPSREHLQITSFDDPRLNGRRIGLQILEEDMAPPSLPLIRSGHAAQLVGFESFGSEGNIVKAVATGRVGASVVWGPIAGYFAAKQHLPVTLTPVSPSTDPSGIPFAFSIAMGVHPTDKPLLEQLNLSISRLQPHISHLLQTYHVPTQIKEAQ